MDFNLAVTVGAVGTSWSYCGIDSLGSIDSFGYYGDKGRERVDGFLSRYRGRVDLEVLVTGFVVVEGTETRRDLLFLGPVEDVEFYLQEQADELAAAAL